MPEEEETDGTQLALRPLSSGSEAEAIGVFARLKPVGSSDTRGQVDVPTRFGKQKNVQVATGGGKCLEFSLDWIFKETELQEDLYNIAGYPRVQSVLEGYNATIMAYGQTGSGKTHTMFGPDEVLTDFINCDPNLMGIVPRASDHIFDGLKHGVQESSFIVQCSYLEVYNNTLNDLLGSKTNLAMREKPGSGLQVEGLSYEMVTSSREVMAALARGNARRVVAAMKMNARSSRGHAIFTIYVKEILAFGGEKAGKLNLVDLAGMESSKKSYAVEGASNNPLRVLEAKNINTSLYALGSVIEKLSEASRAGGSKSHVPYRDSKLTRLLQDSLGGNSKTSIIVTLRIESQNVDETIQTLRFAQRAKAVKTVVKDNTITVKDTDKLVKEIDELNLQLETSQLMVRDLHAQLARREAEEFERLERAREDAAELMKTSNSGDASASAAEILALRGEVAMLKHKNMSLLHHKILHRVLKVQSESAFMRLRAAYEEEKERLSDAESVIAAKERETRELMARNEELQRAVHALRTGRPLPAGISIPRTADDDFDEWREDMISKAEAELKAAMSAGDPERLKAAIANASATVAKARARGSHVIKRGQILHGDGTGTTATARTGTPRRVSVRGRGSVRGGGGGALEYDDGLTEEERKYVRFNDAATSRKLALASRGYEVHNIFIDNLFDLANENGVEPSEWVEFLRLQIPSPRPEGEDETIEAEGRRRLKAAGRKVANVIGWRAKFGDGFKAPAVLVAAAPLMERPANYRPEEPSGVSSTTTVEPRRNLHRGKSLHMEAFESDLNLADNAIAILHNSEPNAQLTPTTKESRAQRYNQKLRERMDAREVNRKPTPRM